MFHCILIALVNHTRSQYLKRTKHSVFMLPVIVWRLCCRINSLSDHSKRRLAKSTNGFCKPRLETPCTFRFLPIHIIEIALKIAILDKTKRSIYSHKMYTGYNNVHIKFFLPIFHLYMSTMSRHLLWCRISWDYKNDLNHTEMRHYCPSLH